MRRKKSIIGIVLTILMIINIFPTIKASAAGFTPRYSLSYEDTQTKYWASGTYGVSNGFPRNWNSGYSGGNCTWYAFGRAWELLGTLPNLCTNNAGAWYSYNKNNGYYPYGSTPKLGAIACWDHYDNDTGHVAVVEEIGSDYIVCSESGWSYTNGYFSTKTRSLNDSTLGMGSSYRFLGYIYIIDVDQNPPGKPTITKIDEGTSSTPTTFYWNKVSNADRYKIFIRYSDDTWTSYSGETTNNYFSMNIEPGSYKVDIQALNAYGYTDSDYTNFTVHGDAPYKPVITSIDEGAYSKPTTFYWNKVSNADRYKIFIRYSDDTWTSYSGETTNNYFSMDIAPGSYKVDIQALNTYGYTDSGYKDFAVHGEPLKPVITSIDEGTASTPTTFYWNKVGNADRYKIFIRYSDDTWTSYSGETTNNYFSMNIAPGSYKVDIQALNGYGYTDSGYKNFTVYQSNPTTSTTATRANGTIEVQTTISNLSQSASYVAAVYDSSGKLLGQTTNDVDSSTESLTAYLPNYSNASYIKVYLWNSLNGMKPLTDGEKVSL